MAMTFWALASVCHGPGARSSTFTRQGRPGDTSPIYRQGNAAEKVADNYAEFYDGSRDSREARKSDEGWCLVTSQYVLTGSMTFVLATHSIPPNGSRSKRRGAREERKRRRAGLPPMAVPPHPSQEGTGR